MTEKNPYQRWMQDIQRVMKEQQADGWITVRCTDDPDLHDEDDSDSDCGDYPSAYTQREVDWIRCVIMPAERVKSVEEMTRLVLGEHYGQSQKLMNPVTFATHVLSVFEEMNGNFKRLRTWSKKLNLLFGFTIAVRQYDSWLDDNLGGRMDDMITELGTSWKRVIKRSSADLGIDDEFTRPGLECLLDKFFDTVSPFTEWSLE